MSVRLELKVQKVHPGLNFEEEPLLEPYITLNTTKRQRARNNFEEDLNNFLNNCANGKTSDSNL